MRANIKLASVATDILGRSGRDMLTAVVKGEDNPKELSNFARGRLKSKKEKLHLCS